MPIERIPRAGFGERWIAFFSRLGLARPGDDLALRWRVVDTMVWVARSVMPPPTAPIDVGRVLKVGASRVLHPYDLRGAFDLLPRLPDTLVRDRRTLELMLNRVLRQYADQAGELKGSPFSFEDESREFFYVGFKIERDLRMISDRDERMMALQTLVNAFYHARNYYYYAVLRRERLRPDSRLHLWYGRASYFLARLDWRGHIEARPAQHQLPSRIVIRFLLRRDKSVIERYRADPAFRDQVRRLIRSFPNDDKAS